MFCTVDASTARLTLTKGDIMAILRTGTFVVEADHPTSGLIRRENIKTVTRIRFGIILLITEGGGTCYFPPLTTLRLYPQGDCPEEMPRSGADAPAGETDAYCKQMKR